MLTTIGCRSRRKGARAGVVLVALAALLSSCGTFDWAPFSFKAPAAEPRKVADHDPAKVVDTSDYRASGPHPRAVETTAKGAGASAIKSLVEKLVRGIHDDFEKAKILHDWIALNIAYDAKAYFTNAIPDQSSESVFRRKTAVCAGYSGLFTAMCGMAGLPCRTLTGHARGYGFRIEDKEDVKEVMHAWNAVRIGGAWYLLDVTWDAGYATPPASFKRRYSTGYLFLQPENMIFTHYPIAPEWQLLDPPLTGEQFVRLPFIDGEYFLWLAKPVENIEKVQHVKGDLTLHIPTPPATAVDANLWTEAEMNAGTRKHVKGTSLVQKEGKNTAIRLAFPDKGTYYLTVSARPARLGGDRTPVLATFAFVVDEPSAIRYPNWGFWDWMQNGENRLLSPMTVPLRIGTRVLFHVELPGWKRAILEESCPYKDGVLVKYCATLELVPGSDGIFRGEVVIPDTCALSLVASRNEPPGSSNISHTMLEFAVSKPGAP